MLALEDHEELVFVLMDVPRRVERLVLLDDREGAACRFARSFDEKRRATKCAAFAYTIRDDDGLNEATLAGNPRETNRAGVVNAPCPSVRECLLSASRMVAFGRTTRDDLRARRALGKRRWSSRVESRYKPTFPS